MPTHRDYVIAHDWIAQMWLAGHISMKEAIKARDAVNKYFENIFNQERLNVHWSLFDQHGQARIN